MFDVILLVLFILVTASYVPIICWYKNRKVLLKNRGEDVDFSFSQDLIDASLEKLKCEKLIDDNDDDEDDAVCVNRFSLQIRGSVRLAHNRILSEKEMKEKKERIYSVELP